MESVLTEISFQDSLRLPADELVSEVHTRNQNKTLLSNC
jgi:hypothetical protein